MTDIRTTQVPLEQWSATTPDMRATSVPVEMWASVQTTPGTIMLATTVLIEQWSPVAEAAAAQQARALILA